ncbi:hypothetical protein J2T02_000296 [Chitinophaga terrae (ex Kim and Jung 2007)]|uniref:hypothetical protein n=1 Tax=Chitinophaga terrae (ex Kim and Jung 2007) TaxID=408074 RepID=UPI002782ED2D|nr:hypothetical protein [Chitinophaga terrae (ex Kim and Jung 2007)]MDQ0105213.1 hypothetical protein [Chitinophaga terrae (ex Kim and Jung 2007)]
MKKQSIFLALCFIFSLLFSCKKSNDSNVSYTNQIKIKVDGKEYSIKGDTPRGDISPEKIYITMRVIKTPDGATFDLTTDLTTGISTKGGDFNLSLETKKGNVNGLGLFEIAGNAVYSDYVEKFPNGEGYKIIGGSVNISKCASSLLEGTFTINVKNSNRTKTVTGSFSSTDPYIF